MGDKNSWFWLNCLLGTVTELIVRNSWLNWPLGAVSELVNSNSWLKWSMAASEQLVKLVAESWEYAKIRHGRFRDDELYSTNVS